MNEINKEMVKIQIKPVYRSQYILSGFWFFDEGFKQLRKEPIPHENKTYA